MKHRQRQAWQWRAAATAIALSAVAAAGQAILPAASGPSSAPASGPGGHLVPPAGPAGWMRGGLWEWAQMLLALALVVGLIFLARFLLVRLGGRAGLGAAGGKGLRVLSRSSLTARHQVFLVRAGDRVLLIGCGPQGLAKLGEFTSPEEVEKLTAEAGAARPRRCGEGRS